MNTIDKFSYIISLLFSKLDDTEIDLSEEECANIFNFSKDIRKELRRSKKLERIEAIIDDYEKYKLKPYRPANDYVRQIKEVIENEQKIKRNCRKCKANKSRR